MDPALLQPEVQAWLHDHIDADVHRLALSVSPFQGISPAALSLQIAARKNSRKKLPTWFATPGIYFPPLLSIEQASSEITAEYKSQLVRGETVADLTGGFGVDSYFFSLRSRQVLHCELNPGLLKMARHNAGQLGTGNISFLHADGLEFLQSTQETYGTIYLDPVRRGTTGKVFLFADCQPNILPQLALLRSRAGRLLIKSSPLIDLQAGIRELGGVSEIHIVSVRNECRELLWILDTETSMTPKIVAASLNATQKQLLVKTGAENMPAQIAARPLAYLFEPDAAVMKSGAFNQVAVDFGLQKIAPQSHLYTGDRAEAAFPGRIFQVLSVMDWQSFKKQKKLAGNIIARNFPVKAAELSKKYNKGAADTDFLIFTTSHSGKSTVIQAKIVQYY
ncbi:hypothetical protein C7T94_12030 [Pedobacter yulinensis]|uniref:Uncharacterized protein n=1 Tax=Pedobacter yulinensis TaxID=2126353 RepID=A0A2T3HLM2_9SPHI|nr:hypothetical protein [Pedobacter yulinensis]PST83303.1 hypothetical protein C7T94_12030 [Pedobacter yulinensis]